MVLCIACTVQYVCSWDFFGRPVVKNLPSIAGDVGLIPGQGTKIPHAPRQLNPCTVDYWALTLEPMLRNTRSPSTAVKTQHSPYTHTHTHTHTHTCVYICLLFVFICEFLNILMGRGNLEHNFKSYYISLNFGVLLIISDLFNASFFFWNSICISAIYLFIFIFYLFIFGCTVSPLLHAGFL